MVPRLRRTVDWAGEPVLTHWASYCRASNAGQTDDPTPPKEKQIPHLPKNGRFGMTAWMRGSEE